MYALIREFNASSDKLKVAHGISYTTSIESNEENSCQVTNEIRRRGLYGAQFLGFVTDLMPQTEEQQEIAQQNANVTPMPIAS